MYNFMLVISCWCPSNHWPPLHIIWTFQSLSWKRSSVENKKFTRWMLHRCYMVKNMIYLDQERRQYKSNKRMLSSSCFIFVNVLKVNSGTMMTCFGPLAKPWFTPLTGFVYIERTDEAHGCCSIYCRAVSQTKKKKFLRNKNPRNSQVFLCGRT